MGDVLSRDVLWREVFARYFVTQFTPAHKQSGAGSDTNIDVFAPLRHPTFNGIQLMRPNQFPLNTSRSFIISAFFAFSLSHCASDPTAVDLPPKAENPFKVHIINNTKAFVDTVQIKPCGTPAKYYTTLTQSIKPEEKVMLDVYEMCIDVVAEDSFQQTVYHQNHIKMTQRTVLTIR
jgi:hypothetical protein